MESSESSKKFKTLLTFNDLLDHNIRDEYKKQRASNSLMKDGSEIKVHDAQGQENQSSTENLDLFSNETLSLFKELEGLCSYYKLDECFTLVKKIRSAVNKELSKCLVHIEENYTKEFKNLLSQPSPGSIPLSSGFAEAKLDLKGLQTIFLPDTEGLEGEELRKKRASLIEQCPKEWPTLIKLKVVQDITSHHDKISTPLPRRLTVKQALSSITGLFAESLATLLSCEVVRVYLYDENHNLHCCATFPYHATLGDPMHATYEEIMLVKDLHQTICGKCIAVNGREATNTALKDGDVERIRQEMLSSGLGSIRSCLIFPILSSEHPQRSVGMIHAVNKVWAPPVDTKRAISFSVDDELLMSMSSRILGCILTRYPVNYFSLRVGEAIRKAVFPREGDQSVSKAHICTSLLQDPIVEDASGVGVRAVTSTEPIKILRASVASIYQTSTHRHRLRRMGSLGNLDATLSSVEFNLNVMNELWKAGITENVAMHQQYRELDEELKKVKLLLENVLDGLSSVRVFREADEMAQYIQMLELYARSESTDILSKFIHNMICEEATRESFRSSERKNSETLWSGSASLRKVNFFEEDSKASGDEKPSRTLSASPFLSEAELVELRRHHERLNAKVASKIHFDGPEGIRSYSCDPKKKREQIRFIDEVMCESGLEPLHNDGRVDQNQRCIGKLKGANLVPRFARPLRLQANSSSLPLSKTDFALKRPFRLK